MYEMHGFSQIELIIIHIENIRIQISA